MTKNEAALDMLSMFLALDTINTAARNGDNFDERKVGTHLENLVNGDLYICTARVDGRHKGIDSIYQTFVEHPDYLQIDGSPGVIVGEYQDRATAELGHDAWIKRMADMPETLRDVDSSMCASVADTLLGIGWRTVTRISDDTIESTPVSTAG